MIRRTVFLATSIALICFATACSRRGVSELDDVSSPIAKGDGVVHLAGGRFRMGTDSAEISALVARYPDLPVELFLQETPAHDVDVTPFDMDRAEVPVHAFEAFVAANPRWSRTQLPASLNNGKYLANWNGSQPLVDGRLPVTFVSWYAAAAYCQWRGARWPTEAEFEFAASAGHPGDVFPWGTASPAAALVNWSGSEIGTPVAVASYAPNEFGLYDMAGNVWQYTSDRGVTTIAYATRAPLPRRRPYTRWSPRPWRSRNVVTSSAAAASTPAPSAFACATGTVIPRTEPVRTSAFAALDPHRLPRFAASARRRSAEALANGLFALAPSVRRSTLSAR